MLSFNRFNCFATKLLAVAALLSLPSCEEDFESRTELTSYRVLGIETSPPEVAPDGQVEVQVHDYLPGEQAIAYFWQVCLHSLGSNVDYECSDPELETALGEQPIFTLDLGSEGLNLLERFEQLAPQFGANGQQLSLADGFDIWLKLRSGPDCESCDLIESVKRLQIRDRDSSDSVSEQLLESNANPEIERFSVRGPRTAGSTVTLRLETDLPQSFKHRLSGEIRDEEYLYTWYSSLGETDPSLTFGSERQTELILPASAETGDRFDIAVAVRDGRGGLAVRRREVIVE